MLTDRGTEYCGKVEAHDYELYLGVSGIEHTKDQSSASPDQRDMRTLPQDHSPRNFIGSPFGRRFINLLRSYRPIWINGETTTTTNELIKAKCVAEERPCRPSLMAGRMAKNLGGKGRTVEFI